MLSYRRRVTRDLERWTAQGWVTPEGARQILLESGKGGGVGLAGALAIIASVLLGFALMSFVAAHWDGMTRGSRLAMLLSLIVAAYVATGVLMQRGQRAFGEATTLFGCAAFGGSIALVSQMYHIDGYPPDGVLLWWVGTLVAAVVLASNATAAFALVLVWVWAGMEMGERNTLFWPFLIGWAAVSAVFAWRRWWPGLHLSALALAAFVVVFGYMYGYGHNHKLVVVAGLAVMAACLAGERLAPQWLDVARAISSYGLIVALCGLFALQFIESPSWAKLAVYATAALSVSIGAVVYGLTTEHRPILWIGYLAFSAEILWLYWTTIGSILGTSVFFLSAGLLVAILAFAAWWIAKRASQTGVAA